jgi:hypothetical protein
MAMVSMEQSAEEADEGYGEVDDERSDKPKYPYGLRITLDDGSLAKLGLTQPPKVGSTMTLTAKVTVCSASSYEDQDGEPESSSTLQITAMEIGEDQDRPDAASMLYA